MRRIIFLLYMMDFVTSHSPPLLGLGEDQNQHPAKEDLQQFSAQQQHKQFCQKEFKILQLDEAYQKHANEQSQHVIDNGIEAQSGFWKLTPQKAFSQTLQQKASSENQQIQFTFQDLFWLLLSGSVLLGSNSAILDGLLGCGKLTIQETKRSSERSSKCPAVRSSQSRVVDNNLPSVLGVSAAPLCQFWGSNPSDLDFLTTGKRSLLSHECQVPVPVFGTYGHYFGIPPGAHHQ